MIAVVSLAAMGYAPHAVTSLPDLKGGLTSKMYAGYLNATGNKRLFYTFVESQHNPAADPLLMWTNGGPGCSSMEGFLNELGPYTVDDETGGLRHNPFAWNQKANYLFIEHPVGVGFSYTDKDRAYLTLGDHSDANTLYEALQNFLELYPTYANNSMYLSGESYAGEYVPHLAYKIAIEGTDDNLRRMLKGVLLGNPVFNCDFYNNDGLWGAMQLNMFYYHGMLSYDGAYAAFSDPDNKCATEHTLHDDCLSYFQEAYHSVGEWDQMLDDEAEHVKQQIMNKDSGKKLAHRVRKALTSWRRNRQMRRREQQYTPGLKRAAITADAKHSSAHGVLSAPHAIDAGARETTIRDEAAYDPDHKYQSFCTGNATLGFSQMPNEFSTSDNGDSKCKSLGWLQQAYLNRDDVMAALHVDKNKLLGGQWVECTESTQWKYEHSDKNILTSFYHPLFANDPKFRVLIYSGPEDIATVPHADSQQCLHELVGAMPKTFKRTQNWGPWRADGILLGYSVSWGRLSFATVKGAGHMVPTNQPFAAYTMLTRWLADGNLTDSKESHNRRVPQRSQPSGGVGHPH
jgi:carboxypeptidase C (cathepsin A)